MTEPNDVQQGTYRCPVCGHRDVAEIEVDGDGSTVVCSYCQTLLEVRSRGPDSMRFSVQVAGQGATG